VCGVIFGLYYVLVIMCSPLRTDTFMLAPLFFFDFLSLWHHCSLGVQIIACADKGSVVAIKMVSVFFHL
jgi:hypothetical protein